MEGDTSGLFTILAIALMLWTLPWKGWALWIAAKNNHKWWFIALLLVNTLAILEIIYIFAIGRKALHRAKHPEAENS